MSSRKPLGAIRWLLGEIDGLVAGGVLTKESGEALRAHYGPELERDTSRLRVTLFSIIGTIFIAAGIILLVAHNWDKMGRPARAVLSLLPLMLATAFSLVAVARHWSSRAWRECAGILQTAGVVTSIALVSQTYHIVGSTADFVLTCTVLAIPLVYLLDATVPALLCVAGITSWAIMKCDWSFWSSSRHHWEWVAYWPLMAMLMPYYQFVTWKRRTGMDVMWLSAALGISVSVVAGLAVPTEQRGFWPDGDRWCITACAIAGGLYLLGVLLFPDARRNPLRFIGAVETVGIIILAGTRWNTGSVESLDFKAFGLGDVMALIMALLAIGLFVEAVWRKADCNWAAAGIVFAGFVGTLLWHLQEGALGALVFNAYGMALGVWTVLRGIRLRRMVTCNGGLFVIGALLVVRFVESDYSFLVRGIGFMVIGVGVLWVNLRMLGKRKVAS